MVLFSVALQLLASLPARAPAVTPADSPWSVVALWDIAAVSIAERQLQFPPGFARADVDLALLRERFLPYSNTSLYSDDAFRSEEHTSELQSLMRISYAVFCLKKKNKKSTKYSSKNDSSK